MRLRLTPSASLIPVEDGLLLRSDLSTYKLQGPDLAAVVSELLPLLDGTRDEDAVVAALPEYSRESVLQLVSSLAHFGLVEELPETEPSSDELALRSQRLFLQRWPGSPEEHISRLERGRVLLAGLEPWGVTACIDLAQAGLGHLHLLDRQAKVDAIKRSIAATRPQCDVTGGDVVGFSGPLGKPAGFDLIVVTLAADQMLLARQLALFAHRSQVVSLWAHIDGLEALAGPVVLPGRTPCWNCCRLRMLANSPDPQSRLQLEQALLESSPQPREHTLLAPMGPVLGHVVALEAIKLLTRYTESSLIGRMMSLDLITLESTFHTVIRLPWCDVCGGAKVTSGGGGAVLEDAFRTGSGVDATDTGKSLARVREPDELIDALAGWVDSRTGVIRYLVVNEAAVGEPELPVAATAVLASGVGATEHGLEIGSGKGTSATEAMLGAVGEAIERYSASLVDPDRIRRVTMEELPGDSLGWPQLCPYVTEQYASVGFPFQPLRPNQPIDWTQGRWIDNGEAVWIPALLAYFNYTAPPDEYFCQVTSNGLAAGSGIDDAALRAVFELVERDAFMLTWLCRISARRILLDDTLDSGSQEIIRQLALCGCEVRLYLMDVGIPIPAVVCVGLGDGTSWPGATVSMAAHLDARHAVRKAILEQGHVGPYVRRLVLGREHPIPERPDQVRTLSDHALYYAPVERRRSFDFLLDGGGTPVVMNDLPESPQASLNECALRLSSVGLRAAIVDVTSPDVATGPFRVARALGTNMQPIHFGHRLARLGNPRLQSLLAGQPNPDPHPVA